jgi:hypothetical protein
MKTRHTAPFRYSLVILVASVFNEETLFEYRRLFVFFSVQVCSPRVTVDITSASK